MRVLGLEMLTLLGMPPAEHVRLAAELGCASISTGLSRLPLAQFGHPELYPDWSMREPAVLAETKAALRDTGVHVALGEGMRVRPDGDVRDFAGDLDILAELGARRISAVSMETDLARTYDQLAILAELAAERGIGFLVEFAPPNAINSIAGALAAVDHVGRDRAQMQLDTMHFFRSGAQLADLQTLLAQKLVDYVQLCDAPRTSTHESYMQEALFERRIPGAGELPLRAFLDLLPADLEVGLEVPRLADLQAGVSPRGHAARVVAAARTLIAEEPS